MSVQIGNNKNNIYLYIYTIQIQYILFSHIFNLNAEIFKCLIFLIYSARIK